MGGVEVRPSVEFYDFKAKYDTRSGTQYILPPELDGKIYEQAKGAALRAHIALGAEGATRVDLLVDAQGEIFVLEVNTIPGMTETSLLPKIASLEGLSFDTLVEEILKGALEKD
jgi:D-alanine-D-alanine ligase